jgi:hypothetical protein
MLLDRRISGHELAVAIVPHGLEMHEVRRAREPSNRCAIQAGCIRTARPMRAGQFSFVAAARNLRFGA